MGYQSRMSEAFRHALALPLGQDSKYILFSDCHRGNGRANDNFLKNEFIYLAALRYYKKQGFTYLELGDGDELWENRSIQEIKETHMHSFDMLAGYYRDGRLFSLYGNHDLIKKDKLSCEKYYKEFYHDKHFSNCPLCPGICFYPAIILKDGDGKKDIYLTHGHQVSIMNSTFWKVNRFLVRYVWKGLELLGVPDPTSAAKNNTKKDKAERRLMGWAKSQNVILITGHTHRPMAGTVQSPYFNTGSCVHPAGITGIEISSRCITLVKWYLSTGSNQAVFVKRETMGEKMCIDMF